MRALVAVVPVAPAEACAEAVVGEVVLGVLSLLLLGSRFKGDAPLLRLCDQALLDGVLRAPR